MTARRMLSKYPPFVSNVNKTHTSWKI